MFVDEIEITVEGGKGGNGKVSFFPGKKGPNGGPGGRGGSVYAHCNSSLSSLNTYAGMKEFKAEDGGAGGSYLKNGANGEDLILDFPIGTTLYIKTNSYELKKEGEQILLVQGGKGGLGNDAFKTATFQTPKIAEKGKPGEFKKLKIILRLNTQVGLLGLPNVGKSSLLNTLTRASAKTADYPFTTLEPNLGVSNHKVIADIPGLIEGASHGKGLGLKFLKHIESIELLLHCIASDSSDPQKDYDTIQKEVASYNKDLTQIRTIVLLTKADLLPTEKIESVKRNLKTKAEAMYPISIYDENSINLLKKIIAT